MQHLSRDVMSSFDSKSFYTLHYSLSSNLTLSAGYGWTNGSVSMGQYTTLSSENWQLFYQQGCYFIRNRDFPSLQLGLTQDDRTVPLLRERSGSLGQQWSITRDGEGWQLMNGLLGNSSFLALAAANEVPGMSTSEQGSIWDISSNPR